MRFHCMHTLRGLALMTLMAAGLILNSCGEKPAQEAAPTGAPQVATVTDTAADTAAAPAAPAPEAAKKLKIGVMPKLVGIDFFNAVEKGAKEAGAELGVEVVYDGPVTNDVTKQAAMVDTWISLKYDAICIAPNDPGAIAPVLRKAAQRGAKIVSFDADADPKSRDFFVNQATTQAIAKAVVESMVQQAGPEAKYIYLTGSLTAVNQNNWMAAMEEYIKATYPKMVNLSPTPKASEEDQALATQVTIDILKTYPDLNGIFAMTSVALPGAAEALKKSANKTVILTGLSTPNATRPYIEEGVLKEFVLWNPVDLGYLAVATAKGAADGTLTPESTSFAAGRLGTVQVSNGEVLLGEPTVFNKENIGNFSF